MASEQPVADQGKLQLQKLAEGLHLEYQETLEDPQPPRDLVVGDFSRIAGSWGRHFSCVPIGGDENEVIVATSDPLQIEMIDELELCYGKQVRLVVTQPEEITRAIHSIPTRLMSDRGSTLTSQESEDTGDFLHQLKIDVTDAEDDDAPIMRYVNAIIFKAHSERASDVHVEPFENLLKVRFRMMSTIRKRLIRQPLHPE